MAEDFLTGLLEGIAGDVKAKRDRQQKLQEIYAEAQAKQAGRGGGMGELDALLKLLTIKEKLNPTPKPRQIPQKLSENITDMVNSLSRANELETFMREHPDLQTGPAELALHRSGVGSFLGNLGLQYNPLMSPEQRQNVTQLSNMANQFQDIYRRAITGAQAGFPEIKFLSTSIPSAERQTRENFLTSVGTTKGEIQQKLGQAIEVLDAAGYDTSELRQRFGSYLPTATMGEPTTSTSAESVKNRLRQKYGAR